MAADIGDFIITGSARISLKLGLNTLPLKRGDLIAIPNYSCDVIPRTISSLGFDYIYYRLEDDLEPDWAQLEAVISQQTRVVAVMATHFFGQPTDITKFMQLCQSRGLWLIEDNAHGYGGRYDSGELIGVHGHVGIGSPRKLAGTESGGALYLRDGNGSSIPAPNKSPMVSIKAAGKFLLKRHLWFSRMVKRAMSRRLDPTIAENFREKSITRCEGCDKFSRLMIRKKEWLKETYLRTARWQQIADVALGADLRVARSITSSVSCPWAIPLYCQSHSQRNELVRKSLTRNVNVFVWPVLPKELLSDSALVERRNRLLCVELNDAAGEFEELLN